MAKPAEYCSVRVAWLCLLCLLLATPALAHRAAPDPDATGLRAVRYHQTPPDFYFVMDGHRTELSALAGKPVVVDFWASWCHVCVDEMAYFQQIAQRYGPRVTVVTISNEAPGVARSYLRAHLLSVPLFEDPYGVVFSQYGVSPIPVTLVLDAAGKVSYVSLGGLTWDQLDGAVASALRVGTPPH